MRAVLQRVSRASVTINKKKIRSIGPGFLVFLGISPEDRDEDIQWLTSKISDMRIFSDETGKMNCSVREIEGEILLVSQFTLFASTRKGNRPSFSRSADPKMALPLYNQFITDLRRKSDRPVKTGEFGAHMDVELCNDGPVTIIIDSQNRE
ncbi:D-tyrosyl-tRNA(Tyr) deacylase [Oceanispirochaeta crateris]|uniref:D-aminoacyl-tRNA deacylase n=1 Tax=Oceanispirochaeta crateris TaxID=2518645 RepID=A0A5C1QPM0_9SPIO|nr:D-aminoacyl-tRNA deacylase [Oceanispirochaeta crateris]QEN08516.1 D-tyrosyl-tRNA(Tyr) deacylase [Oceanispirochaeta crateris]